MAFRTGVKIFRHYFQQNVSLRTLNNYRNTATLIKPFPSTSHSKDQKNSINEDKKNLHSGNANTSKICAETPNGCGAVTAKTGIFEIKKNLLNTHKNKMAIVSLKPGIRHFHTNRASLQVGANKIRKLLNTEMSIRKTLTIIQKRFIHPIYECPPPPPPKEPCGYLYPPPEPELYCPQPCARTPAEKRLWSQCGRMCIRGCPLRRQQEYCFDEELVQPCYEKMLPPTPSFSECRCNPIPKPILCPECYPKFPSCPKPPKYSVLCQALPLPRRLDCIPRPKPRQKPWSEIERCNIPQRCYNPWRADDHYPPKQWKPLPPVFPSFPPPTKEFIFSKPGPANIGGPPMGCSIRAFSTFSRQSQKRAYSTSSPRQIQKPIHVISTIIRKMSLWPPPPCRTMYPRNCRVAEKEYDPCIRELRRRTEGLGCMKEVRPATGNCYRWHKRVNKIVGNISQYDGRAKPDSPFFPKFRRAFSTMHSPFAIQMRNYATGHHMHDTFSTFLPMYQTRLIKCRAKCVVLKDDIQKLRNQTEGCCIVPEPCSIPKKIMERIDPLEVQYDPVCNIPRLWHRPISLKLFAEKNCIDIRKQTEGECRPKCLTTFKLPGCTQRFRIDCASALAYFPCRKNECPHPSYSECKEDDPYRDIHECTFCQDSITPPNFYQKDPDCSCAKGPCKRTWSASCEDKEKEYIDPRTFRRIRCFTTYDITSRALPPSHGLKRCEELKRLHAPKTDAQRGFKYSVKGPSDMGTIIYGRYKRSYSTYTRSRGISQSASKLDKLVDVTRTELIMDPSIGEKCCKEKCEELCYDCEIDTPENRKKYCISQRRDTYSCGCPPERTDAHCIKQNNCPQNNCNPTRNYSTFRPGDGIIRSLNAKSSADIDVTPSYDLPTDTMRAESTKNRMKMADEIGNFGIDSHEHSRRITTRRQQALVSYTNSLRHMSSAPSMSLSIKSDDAFNGFVKISKKKLLSSPVICVNSLKDSHGPNSHFQLSLRYSTLGSMSAMSTLNRMQSSVKNDEIKENVEYAKIITARRLLLSFPTLKRKYKASNDRFLLGKLVDVETIDPLISEKCFARKCKQLEHTNEQRGLPPVCPNKPECLTNENRIRYCHRQHRDTYTCRIPPEKTENICSTQIDCWPDNPLKTVPVECSTDCAHFRRAHPQRRRFSTAALKEEMEEVKDIHSDDIIEGAKETDAVMQSMYKFDVKKIDSWDDLPTVNIQQNYNKHMNKKFNDFRDGHVRKHFLSKRMPKFSETQERDYSTDLIELKKQQIIGKVMSAVKSSGMGLFEQTVKCMNPCNENRIADNISCHPPDPRPLPVQCEKPQVCYKNPCNDKCQERTMKQKKRFCDKVCLPGCKPITAREYCNMEKPLPPCHIKEAPYPSFAEKKTFDFARRKINECNKANYELYLRQVKSAQFAPLPNDGRAPTMANDCKEYSTYAPAHHSDAIASSVNANATVITTEINQSQTNQIDQNQNYYAQMSKTVQEVKQEKRPCCCCCCPPQQPPEPECCIIESPCKPEPECIKEPEPERPLELGAECRCMPFQPPCIELKPGCKKPCTPYVLPPPPPPRQRKPCPPPPPPPVTVTPCIRPPRPPYVLVDRCKRWRECCREPPPPKICPCEEPCDNTPVNECCK
ncbi:uncharacterized protein LOC123292007 isoform X2 [Chrysoperla carnea]|uniref:uncharacterized protein LOC123292007 isoform X2 n=1 Tax=Chrysoperla carnea TaxID=189513 RepID=UPI001D08F4ED|nr:uncharacterized protein LOC123292007 isoform X2 [Chrysoperla carnea]